MTIQELINKLQRSVDELGYSPNTHIQIDLLATNIQDTHWNFEVDNLGVSEPRAIAINVYDNEDKNG